MVVSQRDIARLPHRFERSQVDNRPDSSLIIVLGEDVIDGRCISQIAPMQQWLRCILSVPQSITLHLQAQMKIRTYPSSFRAISAHRFKASGYAL